MPTGKCPGCGLIRGLTVDGMCAECEVLVESANWQSLDYMLQKLYERDVVEGHYLPEGSAYDDRDQT